MTYHSGRWRSEYGWEVPRRSDSQFKQPTRFTMALSVNFQALLHGKDAATEHYGLYTKHLFQVPSASFQ